LSESERGTRPKVSPAPDGPLASKNRPAVAAAEGGPIRPGGALFPLAVAACLILILATWANSLSNGFHFDDGHVIVNNLFLRDLAHLPLYFRDARTFSCLPANASYRPMTTLSLALDYRLGGGLSGRFFHASQILFLLLLWAALLVFYRRVFDFCKRGPGNRYLALFAATAFAVHTANSETMNLLSARSELLSALGLVGAFLVYFSLHGRKRTFVSLLPMAAGALAKVPAVLFGPLLFLWNYLAIQCRRSSRAGWRGTARRVALALAAAAPACIAGLLLFVFIRSMDAPGSTYGGRFPASYARTQLWVVFHYLRLFVLPIGLTADSDLQQIADWYDTRVIAGVLAVVGVVWLAVRCAARRDRWPVSFGLGWFLVTLLPTSSFFPLAETMNEHRVFLPYIGLALAAVWGGRVVAEKMASEPARRSLAAAAALGVVALAIGSHVRNEVWSSDETLWADVTRKSPGNGRGWMNYGLALMARGDLVAARDAFERASVLTPNYWALEINRGIVNGALGSPQVAESHFQRAIQLEPRLPDPHFYFARWLVEQGRSPEALASLERAIAAAAGFGPARLLRMDLLAARGDAGEARHAAAEFLALDPSNERARSYASGKSPIPVEAPSSDAYFRLGLALGQQKNFVDSALAYRAAERLDPRSADALNNLGWTLCQLGFVDEAIPVLERALEIRSDFDLARNNLAWARGRAPNRPVR